MATVLTKDGRQSSAEDLQEKSDVKHLEDDKKVAGAMNVEAEIHWRTIAAVFFSAFIAFAQLLSITGPANIITFVVSDLGRPDLSVWIIQAPTIVQGSLAPFVGRLSDDIGRRWIVIIAPIFSVIGAIIASQASSMQMLICGKVIGALGLTAVGLITSIPSEVLPSRLRPVGQATLQIAGSLAGIVASLGTGALVGTGISGWKKLFYIEIALCAFGSFGFFLTYHPPPRPLGMNKTWGEILHSCDPIGCSLIAGSFTLIILALNWGSSTYGWKNPHFYAPFSIGIVLLGCLIAYEWKGRSDGIVHHGLFVSPRNYSIAAFALFIEGWIYFSGVAAYFPQQTRYLGWETRPFYIGLRKFAFNATCIFMVVPVTYLSTKFKDVKWILTYGFAAFLTAVCCFAASDVDDVKNSIAYVIVAGTGMAPQLILLVMVAQFASPPPLIATATSLVATVRAIGGGVGSAVMGGQVNSRMAKNLGPRMAPVALANGITQATLPAAIAAFRSASPVAIARLGLTPAQIAAILPVVRSTYASAFRWAWVTLIPPTALGLVAILLLDQSKNRERMTKLTDATVEKVPAIDAEAKAVTEAKLAKF